MQGSSQKIFHSGTNFLEGIAPPQKLSPMWKKAAGSPLASPAFGALESPGAGWVSDEELAAEGEKPQMQSIQRA